MPKMLSVPNLLRLTLAVMAVAMLLAWSSEERFSAAAGLLVCVVAWALAARLGSDDKPWPQLLGAACAGGLVYLAAADVSVDGRGRWWADHPMIGAAIGGGLLLAVTVLLIEAVLERAEQRRFLRAAVIVTDRMAALGRTFGQRLLQAVSRIDELCLAEDSDDARRRVHEQFVGTIAIAAELRDAFQREVAGGSMALASAGLQGLYVRALRLSELTDKLVVCIERTPDRESSFKFLWALGGPWAVWNELECEFQAFDRDAEEELRDVQAQREWEIGRPALMMLPPWPRWSRDDRLMTWLRESAVAVDSAPTEAEDIARWAIAFGHADETLRLGLILLEQPGREREAERFLREAHDSGNTAITPMAATGLGSLLGREGHLQEAEELLRAAIESGDEEAAPLAMTQLGTMLADEGGRDAEAEDIFRVVMSGDHTRAAAAAAINLSELLVRLGRDPEAEEALRRSVAIGGDYGPTARGKLGRLLAGQSGREPEAEQAFRDVVASDDEDAAPRAAFALAVLLLREPGHEQEATDSLRLAMASGHDEVEPAARKLLEQLEL